jgi:hypothetical protein
MRTNKPAPKQKPWSERMRFDFDTAAMCRQRDLLVAELSTTDDELLKRIQAASSYLLKRACRGMPKGLRQVRSAPGRFVKAR